MPETARHEAMELRLQQLSDDLQKGRLQPVRRLLGELPPSEMADLLESLPPGPRAIAWELIDPAHDGEILVHVNDEVRTSLIESMDNHELVQATSELDLDDLADILDDLPDQVIQQLLQAMDREDRQRLQQVLAYPEDSAGGLMDPDVVTVRSNVSLDVVMRYLRMRGSLPDACDHLIVLDRNGRYRGRLGISDLLTRDPQLLVADAMDTASPTLNVEQSATEVASAFEHHDWISAPVVDGDNRVVGRITVDDIVDFIREEADHSVLAVAGLDEEEDMFAPVIASTRRRALYLGLNLLTALIASWCISMFGATIEQVVALAILMPVVASMGGIAGTQTLTLMIRGMAIGQVGASNTRPLLNKELAVGTLNGLLWAAVIAGVAVLWFGDTRLGFVVAFAILANLIAGALAGVMVPVLLRRISVDPALAGGMVLTTVTDVVGFVSILGLGTALLI